MKKFVAFVLAMVMVFSLAATVASADGDVCSKHSGMHHSFQKNLSTNGTSFTVLANPACERTKQTNDQRIYVYHCTHVGVADMTNLFIPFESPDGVSMGSNRGSKWVTPELKIPIRSDNTKEDMRYNVKARGNTDHALSGYTTITVSGYYSVN